MDYGVMQGRLSPRQFPKLNAFPHKTWREEFYTASELQLKSIEWIFEVERYEENPIWTSNGRREILRIVKDSGVAVTSLCADYFLPRHFYRDEDYLENIELLKELIQKSAEVGVKLILLPVLEEADIHCLSDKERLIYVIGECLETMKKNGLRLGLEMNRPAQEYLSIIRNVDSSLVGAYYDTGNSAGNGFDMRQDLAVLFPVLFGVHLKDKCLNSSSVYIGNGCANFKEGIPFLKAQQYIGTLIYESFYEYDPIGTMRQNISLLKSFEVDSE